MTKQRRMGILLIKILIGSIVFAIIAAEYFYQQGLSKYESNTSISLGCQESMEDFIWALRFNPIHATAHFRLGYCYYEMGKDQAAFDEFTQAIQIQPTERAYLYRGHVYMRWGNASKANNDFTQAIKINPDNFSLYINRAFARTQLGDIAGALQDYNQSIQLSPHYLNYLNRCRFRAQIGDKQGALEDCTQSLLIEPEYNADTYYFRAGIRDELGDQSGALEDYRRAVEFYEKNQLTGDPLSFYQMALQKVKELETPEFVPRP